MKKDTSSNIRPATLTLLLVVLVATLHVANTAAVNSNGIPVRFDDTQLWRIHNIPEQSLTDLSELLEKKYDANIWKDGSQYLDVSIDKEHVAAARSFLKDQNLTPEVLNSNIQELFDNEISMGANLTQSSRSAMPSAMNWNDYQDVETIYAYLREMTVKYPEICKLHTIGKTVEGRELLVLSISESPDTYKKIWIDGGIHAREWISPATVTFIIDKLLTNWDEQPCYIKQKTWYIMPVVNPDGYHYSRTVNRMWRKNRSFNKGSSCRGVDLNRNFNIGWSGAGSSTDPCSDVYRGESPASELETRAVVKFLATNRNYLEAYLTFHSYSQLIVYPWAYKRAQADDAKELQSVADLAAQRIKQKTGKVYRCASTHQIFPVAGGGSDDWTKAAFNTRFVYTVELRDRGEFGFALPPNQILDGAEEGFIVATTVAKAINAKSEDDGSSSNIKFED